MTARVQRIFDMMVKTGGTLAEQAPFFKLLPLIFGVGIVLMLVFGIKGLFKGRTLWLIRTSTANRGFWVEGVSARILGVLYLGIMLPLFAGIGIPLSVGILGL